VATPRAASSDFYHRTRAASATHLLESGYDIRKDVKTSLVYTHVLNKGDHEVHSPVDAL
jgi:site-specific recombinase XerD